MTNWREVRSKLDYIETKVEEEAEQEYREKENLKSLARHRTRLLIKGAKGDTGEVTLIEEAIKQQRLMEWQVDEAKKNWDNYREKMIEKYGLVIEEENHSE